MKMDMHYAFKYNKITIAERCINKNIRYVGEYQLKIKTVSMYVLKPILLNVCSSSILLTIYTVQGVRSNTVYTFKEIRYTVHQNNVPCARIT